MQTHFAPLYNVSSVRVSRAEWWETLVSSFDIVLVYILPEDGPFGPKHVVNKSPIFIINNP